MDKYEIVSKIEKFAPLEIPTNTPSFFAIFSGTIKSYRFLGWTHEQYSHRYNMPKLADKTIASFFLFPKSK